MQVRRTAYALLGQKVDISYLRYGSATVDNTAALVSTDAQSNLLGVLAFNDVAILITAAVTSSSRCFVNGIECAAAGLALRSSRFTCCVAKLVVFSHCLYALTDAVVQCGPACAAASRRPWGKG